MKVSRRGILAGLLATSSSRAVADDLISPPLEPVKETFIKGQIMPRTVMHVAPQFPQFAHSPMVPVAVIKYEIFDGEKFVPLNSDAGQRVVADLS